MIHPAPKPKPRPKKGRKPIRRSRVRQKAGKPKRFAQRRDHAYKTWILQQLCAVWGFLQPFGCEGRPDRLPIEPAHLKTRCAGGDDRNNLVPLCPKHHDEQEGHTRAFEAKYNVNLKQIATELTERYDRERSVG